MKRYTAEKEYTWKGGTYIAVYDNKNQRHEIARCEDESDAAKIVDALNMMEPK